ncbi:AAA family ATPase [Methylobacterium sp. WL120]|uniref:AAA family ATPase n=1 Tax=Methylobacterium sp. WL120 TaxID=2603887 RepID=UPI0011CA4C77|nr:AAA family ATPase [Methylobacterium sp. WL120]TXM65399.1 AAA family ATPase [Methylobacterium sp. WL120]
MSKPHPTRGRRVAATRLSLQDPSQYCGPIEPQVPLTLQERLLGGEMVKNLPGLDLAITIVSLTETGSTYPSRVRLAARRAAEAPSAKTAAALERALRRELDRDDLADYQAIEMSRVADLLICHQAAFGSAVANARMAAMAFNYTGRLLREGRAAPVWLALRSAMMFAEDASEEIEALRHVPEPRYPRLSMLNARVSNLSSELSIGAEAQELVEVDRAVLDGGVGADGTVDPADTEFLDRLIWKTRPEPGPTMVVLDQHGVDHLPGSASSGSSNASRGSTPRAEFQPLAGVALPLVHGIDVAAVRIALDREFPWLADITGKLLGDLVGGRFARFQRTLLVGRPGSGKTRYLRRVSGLCRIPSLVYSAAGVADSAFGGTSRQWSTGRACVPLQLIQRTRTANPCIIVDEMEKAATRRENGALIDTLTALLEPEGSRAFFDPYIETEVDLSAVQYLATANSTAGVAAPLLDRLRVVAVPDPRPQDLPAILATLLPEIRADRGQDEAWCPDLDPEEVAIVAEAWGKGGSIRPLRRIVETLLSGREALAPRH